MERLIQLLAESRRCAVFTGAGVSTLSGISDFRGKNGFYRRKDIDPEKIFDISYFLQDPSYYYLNSKDFIYGCHLREPSVVHLTIAELERRGVVRAVITQNIDMLHQKAGSVNVIEVHGSPRTHRCLTCGKMFSYTEICAVLASGKVPGCPCGGIVKPDIVFFGEGLDASALSAAVREAERADLMLVLGSSLVVQPAASLPLRTLDNRGKIVIVNNMPTPLDRYAEIRFDDLERCFKLISSRLDAVSAGRGSAI